MLQRSPMMCFALKHMEEKIQLKSFRNTQMDLIFITKGNIYIKIYLEFVCINIIISFSTNVGSIKVGKSSQYVVSLIRADTSDYEYRHVIM